MTSPMSTPNIPDEVPDEVMDVLLNVFNSGEHLSQYHAMRAALQAALPLLLEQSGWRVSGNETFLPRVFGTFLAAEMHAQCREGATVEPLYRLKVSNE